MLASAAHMLELERYKEDQQGPCARMARKFVTHFVFLGSSVLGGHVCYAVNFIWFVLNLISKLIKCV